MYKRAMLPAASAILLTMLQFHTVSARADEQAFYSVDQIRHLTIAGLYIGMSQSEAAASLKKNDFEGAFQPFNGATNFTQSWVKVDQQVSPFRCTGRNDSPVIWAITFVQTFDKIQSVDALQKKVIERYGSPTEIKPNGNVGGNDLIYHMKSAVPKDVLGYCPVAEWKGIDCKKEYHDAYEQEKKAPDLTVTVTSKMIKANITDNDFLENESRAVAAAKLAKDVARGEKNSKKTEIGL